MKRNLMPLLGVAFVAAVVATGIFYGLLIPNLQSAPAEQENSCVAAVRALDRGTVLKAEDLRTISLNRAAIPPKALVSLDEAAGLTLLSPVQANQPLTTLLVGARGAAGGASLAIPAGMRAVTIHPADSSGVVAMLRSGSHVDVQVIERGQSILLRRLLEDVEVLSAATSDAANPRPVITLLVGPGDADRLSLADAAMQVRVTLRNPADRRLEGSQSLSPANLFQRASLAPSGEGSAPKR